MPAQIIVRRNPNKIGNNPKPAIKTKESLKQAAGSVRKIEGE